MSNELSENYDFAKKEIYFKFGYEQYLRSIPCEYEEKQEELEDTFCQRLLLKFDGNVYIIWANGECINETPFNNDNIPDWILELKTNICE